MFRFEQWPPEPGAIHPTDNCIEVLTSTPNPEPGRFLVGLLIDNMDNPSPGRLMAAVNDVYAELPEDIGLGRSFNGKLEFLHGAVGAVNHYERQTHDTRI